MKTIDKELMRMAEAIVANEGVYEDTIMPLTDENDLNRQFDYVDTYGALSTEVNDEGELEIALCADDVYDEIYVVEEVDNVQDVYDTLVEMQEEYTKALIADGNSTQALIELLGGAIKEADKEGKEWLGGDESDELVNEGYKVASLMEDYSEEIAKVAGMESVSLTYIDRPYTLKYTIKWENK